MQAAYTLDDTLHISEGICVHRVCDDLGGQAVQEFALLLPSITLLSSATGTSSKHQPQPVKLAILVIERCRLWCCASKMSRRIALRKKAIVSVLFFVGDVLLR